MGLLSVEATLPFPLFASPLDGVDCLKECISPYWSRFHPLRIDRNMVRLCHPGEQIGRHKSCSPLYKWRKRGGTPIHLKHPANSEG